MCYATLCLCTKDALRPIPQQANNCPPIQKHQQQSTNLNH